MNNLYYFIISIFVLTWNQTSAQVDSIAGNIFTSEIHQLCIDMENAGCMKYNYAHLSFSEKRVKIYGSIKVECTPKSKENDFINDPPIIEMGEYKWTLEDDKIIIKNFNEIKQLKWTGSFITGKWSSKVFEFKKN